MYRGTGKNIAKNWQYISTQSEAIEKIVGCKDVDFMFSYYIMYTYYGWRNVLFYMYMVCFALMMMVSHKHAKKYISHH